MFKIGRGGSYYFRSVGEGSKVREMRVNEEWYNGVYCISWEGISGKISGSKVKVSRVVRGNVCYKGRVKSCNVGLCGRDIVKVCG